MIRLPKNTTFTQSNLPFAGDIFYSKNIDLDEEGRIKLSPRAVSVENEESVGAFGIPLAIGARTTGQFVMVTAINPWTADLRSTNNVVAAEDTDSDNDAPPDFNADAHGVWWQGAWYVVDTSAGDIVMYKILSSGDWNDTAIAVTDGKRHPLAVFLNRQTLCIGDGNTVLQYTAALAADTSLVIPSDFEVTKLAYNNNKMAVATKPANDSSGQNNEAHLFIWDGATVSAAAGYGVGCSYIFDVVPYKSSFALLTQLGELLYFNGGGFQLLARLPVGYTPRRWTDNTGDVTAGKTMLIGDILEVEGDLIHVNLNGATIKYGRKGEQYIPNMPGGIWTYNPAIQSAYHRISPSISAVSYVTVANTGVNTTTNVITKLAGTVPTTGSPIKYVEDPTDVIGGLTPGVVYYCIKDSSTTFRLATTLADALADTEISLTTQAAGTSAFLALELKDYGQSYFLLSGAMKVSESNDLAHDNFVFGGNYLDSNSTTSYGHLNFTCREFENIGYFVTSRIFSQNVEDNFHKVYIKHKRLSSTDSIEVKVQTTEYQDIPVTTPQHDVHCTWSDTDTFTTTADLSEALTLYDAGVPLECEIISGAGAGQMSQIASITESNGTYTVNLDDTMLGVAASDICDIKIENWESTDIQSNTDQDYFEFPIDKKSASSRYKVIMKGNDVVIEEVQIINTPHKPAV